MLRIGIDTGGTFTDFVVIRNGRIEMFKELSTPKSPDEAILAGLGRLAGTDREVIHGSTVGTNALLERKGAKTALLATEGFEDVVVIGRQTRRDLYDIFVTRPEPLAPAGLRFGVRERVLHDGSIHRPLDLDHLQTLISELRSRGAESVAVSLLFSFAHPEHELAVGEALKTLGIPVSLSSVVLPEYREYERTSTTLINAYLAPVMQRYLGRLEQSAGATTLKVMQSNGGAVHARTAAETPVTTILSGPAGGVVGALHLGSLCGYTNLITFDMGGTSTDVALCDGSIRVTHESQVDSMPVGIPMMDIHTVGAGGGSIAELDTGGALKVGPESAGAEPGPICYGKGTRFTVTDANVVLGRLRPEFFLGGAMKLTPERIEPALRSLEWTNAWKRREELAQGVIDIVNHNMENAIRLISVERGFDPRDFTLVCFGGAGGLHAAALSVSLDIPRVLIPRHPGALSALGLLLADARKDYSKTLIGDAAASAKDIQRVLDTLHREGMEAMEREGFTGTGIRFKDAVDLRYRGQSYEISVPWTRRFIADFHKAHEKRYGYASPLHTVEVVNVRCTFLGRTPKPRFPKARLTRSRPVGQGTIDVWFDGKKLRAGMFDRDALAPGQAVKGPAVIGEYSSTTAVPPGFRCHVDAYRNLVLERQ